MREKGAVRIGREGIALRVLPWPRQPCRNKAIAQSVLTEPFCRRGETSVEVVNGYEVDWLKNWIADRIGWMDSQVNSRG